MSVEIGEPLSVDDPPDYVMFSSRDSERAGALAPSSSGALLLAINALPPSEQEALFVGLIFAPIQFLFDSCHGEATPPNHTHRHRCLRNKQCTILQGKLLGQLHIQQYQKE